MGNAFSQESESQLIIAIDFQKAIFLIKLKGN
jgi:hypothetical protein